MYHSSPFVLPFRCKKCIYTSLPEHLAPNRDHVMLLANKIFIFSLSTATTCTPLHGWWIYGTFVSNIWEDSIGNVNESFCRIIVIANALLIYGSSLTICTLYSIVDEWISSRVKLLMWMSKLLHLCRFRWKALSCQNRGLILSYTQICTKNVVRVNLHWNFASYY